MYKIIENDRLLLKINRMGSELARIYDKKRKSEVLWDGNPKVWPKHSPLLFPMIGQSYLRHYNHDGKRYPMEPHGFAWTSVFEFTKATDIELHAVLESSEETLKIYPFHFKVEAIHQVIDDTILVSWRITNTGSKTMYFNIGGHPAFNIPEDYKKSQLLLQFSNQDMLPYIRIDYKDSGCAFFDKQYTLQLGQGIIPISEEFWDKGVYIFEGGRVDRMSILYPDKTPYVTVFCEGFPYAGIWTKPEHPFICLEPWYGRCDNFGYTGELKDKTGVITLVPHETMTTGYSIKIH